MTVAGLLLAAGEGRRFGGPKALAVGDDGETWVRRRAMTLVDGGCSPVVVVIGAAAPQVAAELAGLGLLAVTAENWQEGMGASLRAGLDVVTDLAEPPDAVLVALVDTPGLTPEVVARLVACAGDDVLAQATYDGEPGHPVLIGHRHWAGVRAVAVGDRGARDYLASRSVTQVECGDVGEGLDIDRR